MLIHHLPLLRVLLQPHRLVRCRVEAVVVVDLALKLAQSSLEVAPSCLLQDAHASALLELEDAPLLAGQQRVVVHPIRDTPRQQLRPSLRKS